MILQRSLAGAVECWDEPVCLQCMSASSLLVYKTRLFTHAVIRP